MRTSGHDETEKRSGHRWGDRLRRLSAAASLVVTFTTLLALVVYAAVRALLADFCSVTPRRVLPSPTAEVNLVIFEVDCGATTSFNTQASIVPSGAKFSRERYPPFFVVKHRHELVAAWAGDREVEIVVPRDEQVYRQESIVSDIAVIYK
jgi:hypothetical protein